MEPFPYRLERLSDANLHHVRDLLATVLRKRVSLDWVRHKYDTRHTGVQYVSCLAFEGAHPVGFYGAIPQVFTSPEGGGFVGCHIADNMTLPSHQRRGIFKATAQQAFSWMRDQGVHVVYGFSSVATMVPHERMGFKSPGALRGYVVPAGRLPLARGFRRLPLLRTWQHRRVRHALAQYALPPEKFHNSQRDLGIAVEYSPAFFESKRFHPQYLVTLEGVRFWLCVDAAVRVGDAHFSDTAQLMRGLAALQRLTARLGMQEIIFQTQQGSTLDMALQMQYTGFASWPIVYLEFGTGFDFAHYRANYADQDSF